MTNEECRLQQIHSL